MIAVIPARLGSTRLARKMLCEIAGKPLILHTMERAKSAKLVDRVIVATDSQEIFDVVVAAGGEAMMTSQDHQSGSDRIAEVAEAMPAESIIINVQGDEPLISPDTIDAAVQALIDDPNADISTASEPITSLRDDVLNFNVVKVVVGENGYALYFSRSPIPFPREASLKHGGPNEAIEAEPELLDNFRKHTGIYVYRREYLLEFTTMKPSRLEQIEMLEQLRAMENGAKIRVIHSNERSVAVDTLEDLERVEAILSSGRL
ncbi:MAG: 3-deoxy-manno-octulosonate cytidylyltransferase [Blastocatellia bacterium]|nr:3-deoxy-manno-octulosonate cytidylyltransferase [Blastocatellia bacterium]